MKRILIALAGYALYRWWTTHEADPAAPAATRKPRGTPQKPAQPA